MLNDQMLWFLLVFSVPFIPAFIVFLMIKPESGDAKVGGGLPIFKDLKIELAGGIATYLVVVLIALVAYKMITKDELISFEITPKGPAGEQLSMLEINPRFLVPPIVNVKASEDDRANWVEIQSDLIQGSDHLVFKTKPIYRVNGGESTPHLFVEVLDSSSYKEVMSYEVDNRSTVPVEVHMKNDILADWLSILTMDRISYDAENDTLHVNLFLILRDNSVGHDLSRIPMGVSSLEGLQSAALELFKVDQSVSNTLMEHIDTLRSSTATAKSRLRVDETIENLMNDAIELDRVDFTYEGDELYKSKIVRGDRNRTWFIAGAPAPRIRLPEGWNGSKNDAIVRLSLEAKSLEAFLAVAKEYSMSFNFGTKFAIFDLDFEGYDKKLRDRRGLVEFESPVANELTEEANEHSLTTDKSTYFVVREVPKSTRAWIPLL